MPRFTTNYGKTKIYDTPLVVSPSNTEELFPVKEITEDGIFVLNENRYSKLFKLSDINFAGVTDMEQKAIIVNFGKILNGMQCRFSYTVANEYVDPVAFSKRILYKMRGDGLDELRSAFNEVISTKVTDAKQGLYQTIYMTLTVTSPNIESAKSELLHIEAALSSSLTQIGINGMGGSVITPVEIDERMQLWYNFTHSGLQTDYKFHFHENVRDRRDWKSIVAPESLVFYNDYFVMNGNRYGRAIYFSKHATSLDSNCIAKLSAINSTIYISVNNEIINLAGYKQEIIRKFSSVGMKIERQKQSHRNQNDYLSDASDDLLSEKSSLEQLSRSVESGDDHYFNTTIMILYIANSLDELNKIDSEINYIAGAESFEVKPCFDRQREGINSAFPFGVQEFKRPCNLSAMCVAMYMPFKTEEINDEDGSFYGVNKLSMNPIFGNRHSLQSYHGMFLGKTRHGKSQFAKCEILSTRCLHTDDQILVIDPQNEYRSVAFAPGVNGSIVSFDTQKEVYVNPLDVDFENVDYSGLEEIIAEKTDFIITLLSSCMKRDVDSEEQGLIDKVVEKVLSENYSFRRRLNGDNEENTEFSVPAYMQGENYNLPIHTNLSQKEQVMVYSPTLQDIYQKLKDMDDNLTAQKLAAHMMIFVNGSLNLFNHKTNIDLDKKTLIFDLSGIKENIRTSAMLVMLEIVKDKIKENFQKGNWSDVYIDEFHELLGVPAVASYVIKLWKEVGKLHGSMTGITQNMTDLLNNSPDSDKLAAIIGNTEYFVMFDQSSTDVDKLEDFLRDVSPAMFSHVTGAPAGTGLIKMGSVTIPFDFRMSKSSRLYSYSNSDGNDKNNAV